VYERLTDRARKVMQLANQEAQRFNHQYIGSEHILLGLVKEGAGVAASVLKNLGVDLRKVRLEVEKIAQPGPDRITLGKLPLMPRAKKIIDYSIEEARDLKHIYVGTEHILLGLIRDEEGMAFAILTKLGLTVERLREGILSLLSDPRAPTEGFADQAGRWLPLELRTRALEQQLANVRLLLGALFGAGVGVMLGGRLGAVLGLLVGGGIALFGRLIPALLAGGIAGGCVASTHFGDETATIIGAVVGALLSSCVAEIGRPSRFAKIGDTPDTNNSATGPEGRK
jgi:hypothetical protein